ncbi:13916_t:CDS:2 [Gigaspora margarita]|uniref:13916_t:CDS:1 n=1 Tax=Gigaspora margarita TaxID=4874 RepID=A0ABN7UCW4_GIGMA|nr:13916_t:CDS:2 [Gigaspora margarita]
MSYMVESTPDPIEVPNQYSEYSQNLSISESPLGLCSVETPIVNSDKLTKRRKSRSKTSVSSSNVSSTDINKILTKKIIGSDLYALIEQDRKEMEKTERETERILNSN